MYQQPYQRQYNTNAKPYQKPYQIAIDARATDASRASEPPANRTRSLMSQSPGQEPRAIGQSAQHAPKSRCSISNRLRNGRRRLRSKSTSALSGSRLALRQSEQCVPFIKSFTVNGNGRVVKPIQPPSAGAVPPPRTSTQYSCRSSQYSKAVYDV